jgi:thiamine-monophosphate kinase
MQISDIDEFKLINSLDKIIKNTNTKVKVGIGDDGAIIETDPNCQTIVTTDMLIEEVHFRKDKITPFQLGYKSLAVNISDIIAMGGIPTQSTISLGIPANTEVKYIEEIYHGLNTLAQKYEINIIGGDTTSSPDKLIINVNLLGKVAKNNYLLRSTAKSENHILVTGNLGNSKAGLEILLSNNYHQLKSKYTKLIKKHLQPEIRLKEMKLIKKISPITAMNDISDGLASELHEIAKASKVGIKIYEERIPISKQTIAVAKKLESFPLNYALFGGEDYELLFTVPANKSQEIKERVEKGLGTKISIIGEISSENLGVELITSQKKIKLEKEGYNHF